MIDVPYVAQPDEKSCALACYTMVARHFLPETTFDDVVRISEWKPGYVVWASKFWLWMLKNGIRIEDYDLIDFQAWSKEGPDGLKKSVPKKEFEYYKQNTYDLDLLSDDIRKVLANKSFVHKKKKPTFEDLKRAVSRSNVCEVVLDSKSLRGLGRFELHRIVVVDVTNSKVVFHDPIRKYGPQCKIDIKTFKHAWLEAVAAPELCVYSRAK